MRAPIRNSDEPTQRLRQLDKRLGVVARAESPKPGPRRPVVRENASRVAIERNALFERCTVIERDTGKALQFIFDR
jgi:hypothetical protein